MIRVHGLSEVYAGCMEQAYRAVRAVNGVGVCLFVRFLLLLFYFLFICL